MKKTILTILLLSLTLTGCSYGEFVSGKKEFKKEKLKTKKEKIVNEKTIDWIEVVNGEIINKGKIKSYDYISDKKVTGKNHFFKKGRRFTNIKEIRETELLGGVGDLKETTIDFFTADKYFLDDDNTVYEIVRGATTTIENFKYQTTATSTLSIIRRLLGIEDIWADDFDSGSGDGSCYNNEAIAWATLRSRANSTWAWTAGTYLQSVSFQGKFRLGRLFYPVFTDDIPIGATITAASFHIAPKAISQDGRASVMVKSTQADGSVLVVSDFSKAGDTDNPDEISVTLSTAGWSVNTVRTITITDLTVVQTSGYTKMAIRNTDYDIGGTQPPVSGQWIELYTSINGGASYTPYLSVTYTEPSAGGLANPFQITEF